MILARDREARFKFLYLGRPDILCQEDYARRTYYQIRYRGIKTGWMRRLRAIDSKDSGCTAK